MAFLAVHSDDELTPDAAEAAQRFLAAHPGPLSNLDRVLLGSSSVFSAYTSWFELRDELIPFLGERASPCSASRSATAPPRRIRPRSSGASWS